MVWPVVRGKAAGSGFSYHPMLQAGEVLIQSHSWKQNPGAFERIQTVDLNLKWLHLDET